jgi:hypothetical protein
MPVVRSVAVWNPVLTYILDIDVLERSLTVLYFRCTELKGSAVRYEENMRKGSSKDPNGLDPKSLLPHIFTYGGK